MQRFAYTITRNSAAGIAAQLVIKLLSFGFSVFIVRSLGAEQYGQYAVVGAFGSLFLFVGDLGLSSYAIREVSRARDQPDTAEFMGGFYGNILILRILLSALSGLLLVFTAWLTGRPWVIIVALAMNASGMVVYGV